MCAGLKNIRYKFYILSGVLGRVLKILLRVQAFVIRCLKVELDAVAHVIYRVYTIISLLIKSSYLFVSESLNSFSALFPDYSSFLFFCQFYFFSSFHSYTFQCLLPRVRPLLFSTRLARTMAILCSRSFLYYLLSAAFFFGFFLSPPLHLFSI